MTGTPQDVGRKLQARFEDRASVGLGAADAPATESEIFFQHESQLAELVAGFLTEAFRSSDAMLVLATEASFQRALDCLSAQGCDVHKAEREGRLVWRDARAMLGTVMQGQRPSELCLHESLGAEIPALARRAKNQRLLLYSEMADLLWQDGNRMAAVILDQCLSELPLRYPVSISCASALAGFYRQEQDLRGLVSTGKHVRASSGVQARVATDTGPLWAELTQRAQLEHVLRASLRASRRANANAQRMMKVTAALAEAISREQVVNALVETVGLAIDAATVSLWLVSQDGQKLELARALGYAPEVEQAMRTIVFDGAHSIPALDVLRSKKAIWFSSQQELLADYPHLASYVTRGRAYGVACLPLLAGSQALGALAFTFDDDAGGEPPKRELLEMVASYSGQALQRLTLFEDEQRQRSAAQAANARLGLLSRASGALTSAGHDSDALLDALSRELVSDFADGVGIMVLSDDPPNTLRIVALRHREQEAVGGLRALLESTPLKIGQGASGRVAASGETLFLPSVDVAALAATFDAEYRPWLVRYAPTSMLIVPVRARGVVLGTLCVMRDRENAPFESSDEQLLVELATRAGLALENARLYAQNEKARVSAELLYELAGAVIGARRVEDVFDAALDGLQRALGAGRASILVFDRDGVMRFKAWRGLSDAYRNAVEGHSPWSRDARAPELIVIENAADEASLATLLPVLEAESIAALAFVPLCAGGQLLGKFMVYYAQPHPFGEAELALAEAIANHVATALARFSMIDELQQTIQFSHMFAGILGHDLRNPLAAITYGARLALTCVHEDEARKPLRRILSSGARMARMIDQLLDFTRLRVGNGIAVERRACDLAQLLSQVIDELETAHPGRLLQLSQVGSPHGRWDADRLAQVFSNLLGNALQHGDARSPVNVRLDGSAATHVRVEVHNAGSIDPSLLSTLFEPMSARLKLPTKSQGLGLGLYITHELVKSHAGRIDVQSNTEHGTTLSVYLPRSE